MTSAALAAVTGKRRTRLMEIVRRDHRADAAHLTDPLDIRYLTGLCEGARDVIVGRRFCIIFTGRQFAMIAAARSPGCRVIVVDDAKADIARIIKGKNLRRVVVQGDHVSFIRHRGLVQWYGAKRLVAVEHLTQPLRKIKEPRERAAIREAVRISEKALGDMLARGADYFIGRTERDIAAEIVYRMTRLGSEGDGFLNGILVGSGPDSAEPHHRPTDRKLKEGEPLLIDWGACVDGYRSDTTRTFFMKRVSPFMTALYKNVHDAYRACLKMIRPGVPGARIHARAAGVIAAAGHGDFRHGLGHGLGMAVHDGPGLGPSDPELEAGQVITLEPGNYVLKKGGGGVRLENVVVVTGGGCRVLNRLPLALEKAVLT